MYTYVKKKVIIVVKVKINVYYIHSFLCLAEKILDDLIPNSKEDGLFAQEIIEGENLQAAAIVSLKSGSGKNICCFY